MYYLPPCGKNTYSGSERTVYGNHKSVCILPWGTVPVKSVTVLFYSSESCSPLSSAERVAPAAGSVFVR